MNGRNFNIEAHKKRVLVSPLDWGLGHATRCIPIIKVLLEQGCHVFVAAEGAQKNLLQEEFPGLHFLALRGYRVQYSRRKKWLPVKILLQLPSILHRIRKERAWLKKAITEHQIDVVISDNRYGFYNKKIPCVFITHQLSIQTGHAFNDWLAQQINYYFINKFNVCWVPDEAGANNIAGKLSHPVRLPKTKVEYLGLLSRLEKNETSLQYELAILLSGPEPQRTIFEDLLLEQLKSVNQKTVLVRGLPGEIALPYCPNDCVHIYNHLPGEALNKVILQSGTILCRSGYTSIMDLLKLQKKALLVPTPGQTEQEYLAEHLMQQQFFFSVEQKDFNLRFYLEQLKRFEFRSLAPVGEKYKQVISGFIAGQ